MDAKEKTYREWFGDVLNNLPDAITNDFSAIDTEDIIQILDIDQIKKFKRFVENK